MLIKNIAKHFERFVDDVTLEVAKETYKALEGYLDERYEREAKTRMKEDREGAMVFKKAVQAAKAAAQKVPVESTEDAEVENDEKQNVFHHSV